MFVFHVIGAVGTAVDTIIGQVQRGEHDDPVAIEIFFDLLGKPEDLLVLFLDVTGKQDT